MADRESDPYAALGLAPGASAAEIRAAFRRLAREYHPDVNPDPAAPARFRAVVAAYELLSDPARRAAYDAGRVTGGPARPSRGAGRAGRAGAGPPRPSW